MEKRKDLTPAESPAGPAALELEAVCNAIPAAVEQVVREFGFQEVIHTVAGSTISCHCGPNTLGILFLRK